mmetsp:Transcript_19488/g.61270  ORF Transcript_19488/g.61270 Transcript_19488/m.61270 type:complete len:125 (+) Transcript_19488:25-399(+)
MRLVTHNMMRSNVKDVSEDEGYPLIIEASEVKSEECEFNADVIRRLVPKMDYKALRDAAEKVDPESALPDELPDDVVDEALLRKLHHVLLEIHVVEGDLVCPKTGRRFQITNGIPNMLLHEDEL